MSSSVARSLRSFARGFFQSIRWFAAAFDCRLASLKPKAPTPPRAYLQVEGVEERCAPTGMGPGAIAGDAALNSASGDDPSNHSLVSYDATLQPDRPIPSGAYAAQVAVIFSGQNPPSSATDWSAVLYEQAYPAAEQPVGPDNRPFVYIVSFAQLLAQDKPLADLAPQDGAGSSASSAPPGDPVGGGGAMAGGGADAGSGAEAPSGGGGNASSQGGSSSSSSSPPAPSAPQTSAPAAANAASAPAASPAAVQATPANLGSPSAVRNFAQIPLTFEPNVGQVNGDNAQAAAQVSFIGRAPGATLFLTGTDAVLTLARPNTGSPTGAAPVRDVLDMQFVGANSGALAQGQGQGQQELPSRSSYFTGTDPTQWHANVDNFGKVVYHNLYQGIDAAFYGNGQNQLEYDLIVNVGADYHAVQLNFQGATAESLDAQGNLVLTTDGGQLVHEAPVIYQKDATGASQAVTGQYVLNNGKVGFSLGSYDTSRTLYIDPILSFSSYLGGSGTDKGFAIAVDGAGNTYLTGSTTSSNFPTLNPFQPHLSGTQNVFVARLNPAGTALVYSTYLGGVGSDQGNGIAVDPAGNAVVVGSTTSMNFPTTTGALQTSSGGGFVAKLNATGDALLYSTFLGDSSTAANAVAVDAQGDAFVTGKAGSSFTTTTGAYQTTSGATSSAFASEINPAGTAFVYSTFLGGTGTVTNVGTGIGIDSTGDAYVAGYTTATNFPTASAYQGSNNGGQDAFVTKFNAAGTALVFSTYLGGSATDQANAISVDASGNAYVTGSTAYASATPYFPTTAGAYQTTFNGTSGTDAFVSKLSSTGSLAYSSFLGGSNNDVGYGIAADNSGNATIVGQTYSSNFPQSNALSGETGLSGTSDGFITRLNVGTGLVYSSYLGGSSDDALLGVALDVRGDAYIAGWTTSTNFPVSSGTVQGSSGGGTDAVVAKIAQLPPPAVTAVSPDNGLSSSDQITTSQNLTLSGTAVPSSTVTVTRSDLGVIGTATANTSGTWSYDYSGTTLPEGSYAFTATATVSGAVSLPSAPLIVNVDRTAPTLTLTVPSSTASRGPQVRVTASDLIGLPNDTTNSSYKVQIDVDLNNDGNFTDAGESGYAVQALHNGTALITLPTLSGTGTYPVRARLLDLAGNQATSSTKNIQVVASSPWVVSSQVLTADPVDGRSQEQLGNVHVVHPLDLDQSPGTGQSGNPALVYNSDATGLASVLQITIPTDNAVALPSISASLTLHQGTNSYSTMGMGTPSGSRGDVFVMGVPAGAGSLTTGRIAWTGTVTINTSPVNYRSVSGVSYYVNESTSPFGAGWTISNLDQLVSIATDSYGPAGELWVYGTGGWRFFASNGAGGFTSPANDNGTLAMSGSNFIYTAADGSTANFNSAGLMTSRVSADGQETLAFTYTSGLLTGMSAIDGAATTFSYTAGQLTSIATAGSRTYTITPSLGGTDLASIQNPDGGTDSFTYGSHRPTRETLGVLVSSWSYDSAGFLMTMTQGTSGVSPTVYTVTSAILQSLGTNGIMSGITESPAQAVVTDPLGNVTKLTLDAAGRPTEQDNPDGGVWAWMRDANGRVTSQTDPLGRTTSYTLDSKGYVTQEALPDGVSTIGYAYQTAFHALTQVTDERGNQTNYAYDGSGHQTLTTDALLQKTTIGYLANGLVQTTTDPASHVTSYGYDTDRRLTLETNALSGTIGYGYDTKGNVQTVTDPNGHVTTIASDSMNRPTQVTDALGHSKSETYDYSGLEKTATDALGRMTSIGYDIYGRGLPVQQTDAVGALAQRDSLSNYDSMGRVTGARTFDGYWNGTNYDSMARVTQTTDALGAVALTNFDLDGEALATRDQLGRWTQSAYNTRGEVTQTTDALGNAWTNAFDKSGNMTTQTDPLSHTLSHGFDVLNRETSVTDPLGHATGTGFDAAGNVHTVTDPNSGVTTNGYDALNRQTSVTDPLSHTIGMGYDAAGNPTTQTDGLGHATTTAFDAANRPTSVTDPLSHTIGMGYDSVGNVTTQTDALGKTVTLAYDALNRATSVTDPLSHVTDTLFDPAGHTVATINGVGNATSEVFDPDGRSFRAIDPRGGVVQTILDAAGNTVGIIDPVGNITRYDLDRLNRVTKITDPLGNTTSFGFDSAGRETATTDRDGRSRVMAYDNDNRLTSDTWKNSAGTTVNTRNYSYDNDNNITQASDNAGTWTTAFDAANRPTATTDVWGLSLTIGYDAANRLTQIQDSKSGVLASVYDNANLLTSRQFGGTGMTQARIDPSYDNRNEMTGLSRYSDTAGTTLLGTSVIAFDDSGRQTAITHKNAAGASLSYYNYGYDNADRVTSQTWNSGTTNGSAAYTYDVTNQLLTDSVATYKYDLNGNRTMTGYTTGTDNRLSSDGTWNYTYDSEGNLTQKTKIVGSETWTYGYDNLNHMTSVTQVIGGVTQLQVTYTYDVFNNRVLEVKYKIGSGTTTTRHAYIGQNVWADLDTTNNVLARYIYGDQADQPLARIVTGGTAAGLSFYLTDHLGSVRDIMNSSQSIVDHVDYDGYGNITLETGVAYGDQIKFTSREWDPDTGLQYNRARYFSPSRGSWTSQDPLRFAAEDSNLYRYVFNGPTNSADPSGEVLPIIVIGAVIGAILFHPPALNTDHPEQYGDPILGAIEGAGIAALGRAIFGMAAARAAAARAAAARAAAAREGALRGMLQGMTNNEIVNILTQQQKLLLRQWMGRAAQGARNAMGQALPRGLNRDTLIAYREIALRMIARGLDTVGTQAARLALIDQALGRLGR
jgi:RHS repeat-associated protein